MAEATVALREIHCASCEHVITTALSRLPGVRNVSPSSATDEVKSATTRRRSPRSTCGARLAEIGYDPVR